MYAGRSQAGGASGAARDSDAGSYSRLIDFVYRSTLGLSVKKKKNLSHRCASKDLRTSRPGARETGILSPNNQRQHRTSHAPKDVLPVRICANVLTPGSEADMCQDVRFSNILINNAHAAREA